MIYDGKEVPFPAVMQISFFKVFEQLEEMARDPDENVVHYATQILKDMEKYLEQTSSSRRKYLLQTMQQIRILKIGML